MLFSWTLYMWSIVVSNSPKCQFFSVEEADDDNFCIYGTVVAKLKE